MKRGLAELPAARPVLTSLLLSLAATTLVAAELAHSQLHSVPSGRRVATGGAALEPRATTDDERRERLLLER